MPHRVDATHFSSLRMALVPLMRPLDTSKTMFRSVTGLSLLLLLASPEAHAACEPIRILENTASAAAEVLLTDTLDVIDLGPSQKQMVREAEERLTPILCQAVTRLAYMEKDSKDASLGWVNPAKPDLVNISATGQARENMLDLQGPNRRYAPMYRAGTTHSIIHEAGHSATFLLEANNGLEKEFSLTELLSGDIRWTEGAISAAKEVVKSNRLNGGLENEWIRLHQSFVAAGLALDYHGRGDPEMTDDQILKLGVMTAYAGDEAMEDIAETASGVLSITAFSHEGVGELSNDLACRRMRAAPGPAIPDELAAVFTKVGFVQSLGLIDEIDYRECVGNLRVRGNGNGFFSFESGQENRKYTQNVKGTIGQKNGQGPWIFQIEATGSIGVEDEGTKTARVMLNLELAPGTKDLSLVSFPRGLYRIGPGQSSNNKLIIWYNDGSGEVPAIEVFQGDVLVARASHDLIEGSVFVKQYINHTELFKLPQPPKQERVITFRKEN